MSDNYELGYGFEVKDRVAHFEFLYPGATEKKVTKIQIGVECVRAIDDITVKFDLERNGYVICMDKCTYDGHDGFDVIKEEQEVAFIPAWNIENENKLS
jgi:hypothetical protein